MEQTAITSRLLGVLTASDRGGAPELLVRALGEQFRADAVCLQILSLDRQLVPIAWYARSVRLRDAVEHAAASGQLNDWLGEITPELGIRTRARPVAAKLLVGTPFEGLATDIWIEAIGVRDSDQEIQGILTIVGAASRGCTELSDVERRVLVNMVSPAVAAVAQAKRAERLEQQLQFLTKISQSLASRRTIFERLKATVAAAQSATGFDSIQLLTWDPTGHSLLLDVLYIRDTGFVPDNTWDRMTREEITESSRRFLEDPTPMLISEPADLETVPPHHRRWMIANGIRYLVFVPLVFEGEHLGTLVITSHYSKERTEDRIRTLTALGGHLAAILQLSLVLAQVEESYQRLRLSHRKTIETLALAAEMRDATTGRHLKQLEKLSIAVGKRLALPAEDLKDLAFGAVVHDIGKLHVPDAVLLKPGRLDERERKLMQTHPESGEQILVQSDVPEPVRQIVRWHHERWDGRGYPDGLAGDAIPITVQIITVADVFDALISRRPYKEPWSFQETIEEIKRNRGTQFGPVAADAFLDVIPKIWQDRQARQSKAA